MELIRLSSSSVSPTTFKINGNDFSIHHYNPSGGKITYFDLLGEYRVEVKKWDRTGGVARDNGFVIYCDVASITADVVNFRITDSSGTISHSTYYQLLFHVIDNKNGTGNANPHNLLSDTHLDVQESAPILNNQVLTYDTALSKWTNKNLPTPDSEKFLGWEYTYQSDNSIPPASGKITFSNPSYLRISKVDTRGNTRLEGEVSAGFGGTTYLYPINKTIQRYGVIQHKITSLFSEQPTYFEATDLWSSEVTLVDGDVVLLFIVPRKSSEIDNVLDGSSVGTGTAVYKDKTQVGQGQQLNFKTIKSSDLSVNITNTADEVNLSVTIPSTDHDIISLTHGDTSYGYSYATISSIQPIPQNRYRSDALVTDPLTWTDSIGTGIYVVSPPHTDNPIVNTTFSSNNKNSIHINTVDAGISYTIPTGIDDNSGWTVIFSLEDFANVTASGTSPIIELFSNYPTPVTTMKIESHNNGANMRLVLTSTNPTSSLSEIIFYNAVSQTVGQSKVFAFVYQSEWAKISVLVNGVLIQEIPYNGDIIKTDNLTIATLGQITGHSITNRSTFKLADFIVYNTGLRLSSVANISTTLLDFYNSTGLIADNSVLKYNAQTSLWTPQVLDQVDLISREIVDVVNVGTGIGDIFRDKVGSLINLKTIQSSGGNISVVNNADDIDLNVTFPASGEVNTASNVGTGAGQIYKSKSGVNFNLKTIQSSDSSITVTNNTDDINLVVASVLPHQLVSSTHSDVALEYTYDSISTVTPIPVTRYKSSTLVNPTTWTDSISSFTRVAGSGVASLVTVAPNSRSFVNLNGNTTRYELRSSPVGTATGWSYCMVISNIGVSGSLYPGIMNASSTLSASWYYGTNVLTFFGGLSPTQDTLYTQTGASPLNSAVPLNSLSQISPIVCFATQDSSGKTSYYINGVLYQEYTDNITLVNMQYWNFGFVTNNTATMGRLNLGEFILWNQKLSSIQVANISGSLLNYFSGANSISTGKTLIYNATLSKWQPSNITKSLISDFPVDKYVYGDRYNGSLFPTNPLATNGGFQFAGSTLSINKFSADGSDLSSMWTGTGGNLNPLNELPTILIRNMIGNGFVTFRFTKTTSVTPNTNGYIIDNLEYTTGNITSALAEQYHISLLYGGHNKLASQQDVLISAPATNHYLGYNGSQFVNRQIAYTDISGTPTIPVDKSSGHTTKFNGTILPTGAGQWSYSGTTFNIYVDIGEGQPGITNLFQKLGIYTFYDSVTANSGFATYAINENSVFSSSGAVLTITNVTQVLAPSYSLGTVTKLICQPPNVDIMSSLLDVTISAPANNQYLRYDTATSNWKNTTIPMGSMFWNGNAVATAADTNIWVKITGTSTLRADHEFDMPVDNRLRFIGSSARHFHIVAQFSAISTGGNDRSWEVQIYKNGVADGIILQCNLHGTSPAGSALHTDLHLNPNDYIELWGRNIENIDDGLFSHVYMFAIGM